MYSFSTSFCTVPESLRMSAPCRRATATYSASRIDAVALMVIDVEIFVRSMPSNSRCMSSMESIATPTLPTSPAASGWSESMPICVGKSNATERPVVPFASKYLYRLFDSSASPMPAYWRMVQSRPRYMVACTPRVKGYSPG